MRSEDELSGLILDAHRGDRAATNRLLELIRPELDRLARQWDGTIAIESASDIVQQAELRIWERLPEFRAVTAECDLQAAFRAWLAAIVRTVGSNARRAGNAQRRAPPGGVQSLEAMAAAGERRGKGNVDPPGRDLTPGTKAQAIEEAELVRRAIDALSDELTRKVVRMRFYDGLSLKEIATRTGLSYDTVSDRLHAGLRSLERSLALLK